MEKGSHEREAVTKKKMSLAESTGLIATAAGGTGKAGDRSAARQVGSGPARAL